MRIDTLCTLLSTIIANLLVAATAKYILCLLLLLQLTDCSLVETVACTHSIYRSSGRLLLLRDSSSTVRQPRSLL